MIHCLSVPGLGLRRLVTLGTLLSPITLLYKCLASLLIPVGASGMNEWQVELASLSTHIVSDSISIPCLLFLYCSKGNKIPFSKSHLSVCPRTT